MNPQAIMTPGGIADQFTRGLSGVAQAFAQRSQIDREAQRDAFAQQRALEQDRMAREAFARQGDWHAQDEAQQNREFGLRQQGDARQQAIFDAKMAEANPEQFVNHPPLGGIARRALEARQLQNADLLSKGITPPGRDLVTPLNPTERSAVMAFERGQEKIARDEAATRAKNFGTAFGGAAKSAFNTDARDRTSYINSLYTERDKINAALLNPDARATLTSDNTLSAYEARLIALNKAISDATGENPMGPMVFPATAPAPQGVTMPGSGQTIATPNIMATLNALNNQQPR